MAESMGSHQVSLGGKRRHPTVKQLKPMSATLRLTGHIGGIAFASQKWPIVIDKIVGSIGHGETVDLSIEPGRHTLRLAQNGISAPNEPRSSRRRRPQLPLPWRVRVGRVHHCPHQTGLLDLAPPGVDRGIRPRSGEESSAPILTSLRRLPQLTTMSRYWCAPSARDSPAHEDALRSRVRLPPPNVRRSSGLR